MSVVDTSITLPRLRDDQRAVFYSDALFRYLMCGRRWGKTLGAYTWISEGLVAGEDCGWFVPDFSYSERVWDRFAKTLAPILDRKDNQKHRMYFKNGAQLHVWSFKNSDDPGRGEPYHRVVVDEAGLAKNFEACLMESIFPTLADYGGSMVVQGTPKGAGRDFVKRFQRAQQGEDMCAAFSGKSTDNPTLPRWWLDNAKKVMTPEQYNQEINGIPAEDGGNPFGLAAIRKAIGPKSEGVPVVWGVDLGSTQDWTVIVGIDAGGAVCHLERFQADWEQISNKVRSTVGHGTAFVDQTGVGKPVVERLQLECYGIEGFTFTNDSKHGIMSGLAAAFQLGEIRITDDPVLVNELESFGFSYTNTGRVRYEGPPGMHDDCVCALALAWQCYKQHHGKGKQGPLVSVSRAPSPRVQRRGVRSCL